MPGYTLEANNQSCTSYGTSLDGYNTTAIDCNVMNGGCDWYCKRGVKGAPDTCFCPSGYYMSVTGRDCNDIDECANNTSCVQPQNVCLNTLGSYYCISLSFGTEISSSPQAQQSSEMVGNVASQSDQLSSDINAASLSANQLSISFYALVAWVVVVTVALVAVAVITYRRWRRPPVLLDGRESSFASSVGSARDLAESKQDAGRLNAAFDVENGAETLAQVHGRSAAVQGAT
jgi:hypothetical protein